MDILNQANQLINDLDATQGVIIVTQDQEQINYTNHVKIYYRDHYASINGKNLLIGFHIYAEVKGKEILLGNYSGMNELKYVLVELFTAFQKGDIAYAMPESTDDE